MFRHGILFRKDHLNILNHSYLENSLHCWLIKAREGPPGVRSLKLSGGQPFLLPRGCLCVGASVEPRQLVVEIASEKDVESELAGLNCLVEGDLVYIYPPLNTDVVD